MAIIPSAIIFINNDLVPSVQDHIIRQLHINEVFDGYAFDGYIASNTAYLASVVQFNRRVMVIRPFTELQNRSVADVVIFVKSALASVLYNKFGPPVDTFPVARLHWGQLGIF